MAESTFLSDTLMQQLFPDRTARRLVKAVNTKMYRVPSYRTDYTLLDIDDKVVVKRTNRSCFADLGDDLARHAAENPRYLTYCPTQENDQEIPRHVSPEQCVRWARIGQEIGLLPPVHYQSAENMVTGAGLIIDLDSEAAIFPRIYMQLCWLRWIREGPGIVLHATGLIDEAGCDPWAAIAYCHRNHVGFLDQSLYPFSTSYPLEPHPRSASRDLGLVLQMHQLTYSPEKIDARHFKTCATKGLDAEWNWQRKTTIPPKRFILTNPEMLLSSEVYPVIACGSFERAAELVDQLKRSSSNVAFE